uniref:Uncharacterized protein n=1 Tax=Ditylenchus dipsaci TaxID=166011 RepID=A0A915CXN3_9BILA
MAGSGNLAAGGLAARSLTSGTSGIMSHSPGQQTSGHEHQQSMNVLNMLAQHHHQQQEHSMGAGLLAPELESAPNLLAATEMHYTETFKRAQGAAAYNKKNSSPRPLANAGQSSAVTMSSAEAQRQRKSGVYMLSMDSKEEDAQKRKLLGNQSTINQYPQQS